MKKLLKYGILAITAIAAMSCSKELESTVDGGKKVQLLIPAETVTKTSFNDEMKLQWNADDKIGIFIGETTKNVPATLTRVDGKAYFSATVAEYTAGDALYAYYPYDAANDDKAFSAVTLSVNNSQVQKEAAVFNGSNNPMVAVPVTLPEVGTALSESLKFRHIASIVQFDIFDSSSAHSGEAIRTVQFFTNGLAAANNAVTYDLSKVTENGELTPVSGNANFPTVTVSLKDESATAPVASVGTTAGSSLVYMMIVPGTYTGSFLITTDKGVYRYADRNLTVSRAEMPRYKVDLSKGNSSKEILSAADYESFVALANAGDYSVWKSEDGQVKLGADIAATHEFTRITADWDGVFNGQNHSITQPESTAPLFTKILADAKVCNLVLEGACTKIANPGTFGSAPLAQLNNGTVENVVNKVNISIDFGGTGAAFSGMVKLNAGEMKNCTNEGDINLNLTLTTSNMTVYVGGLADYASDSDGFDTSTTVGKFINCTNKGDIIVNIIHDSGNTARAMQKYAVGGICATVHFGNDNDFSSFENCKNEGYISSIETGQKTSNGAAMIGGIVGKISNLSAANIITAVNVESGYYAELNNCTNSGTVENGSISVGQLPNNTCARTCASGGIVGYANGTAAKPIEITGCTNNGIMKGGCSEATGIGGLCGQTNYVNISGCTVDAIFLDSNTETHKYAVLGGIVGMSLNSTKVTHCFVCINTDLSVGPIPEYTIRNVTYKGGIGALQGYAKKATDSYDNIQICGTLKYGETNTVITAENVSETALLGPTNLKATNITYWAK